MYNVDGNSPQLEGPSNNLPIVRSRERCNDLYRLVKGPSVEDFAEGQRCDGNRNPDHRPGDWSDSGESPETRRKKRERYNNRSLDNAGY